jgi:HEAT repeat protein
MGLPEEIEPLVERLNAPRAGVRLEAQKQLIHMGAAISDALATVLRTGTDYQRAHAAIVLGRIHDMRALVALMEMRAQPDLLIRMEGAKALGALKNAHAVVALVDWLGTEKSVLVQMAIVQVLAEVMAEPVQKALMETLRRTESPSLRYLIIRVLGQRGDPRAIDAIFPYLQDPDNQVQRETVLALRKLGFMPDKDRKQ